MRHMAKKNYAKISQSTVEAHSLVEPYKLRRCKRGCAIEVCNVHFPCGTATCKGMSVVLKYAVE